ncbi:MAG: hypothetical protein M0C28_40240 [Candidatus Moduliflexus flocculans]|nr:hypothetical protein [Candidatus Moduliflexus flocculans]
MKYYIAGDRVRGRGAFREGARPHRPPDGAGEALDPRRRRGLEGQPRAGHPELQGLSGPVPGRQRGLVPPGLRLHGFGADRAGHRGLQTRDRDRQGFGERLCQHGHVLQLPEKERRGPGHLSRGLRAEPGAGDGHVHQ